MGNCFANLHILRKSNNVNAKRVTLIILGLDQAGKTTLVKRLMGEPVTELLPTIGFASYELHKKGCIVSIYDVGGGPRIRDIWKQYYSDVHGVIYVVDAFDVSRMDESRRVLAAVLRHEKIAGKPVLLLANKQDTEGALDEIDVVEQLKLEKLVNEQKCPTLVELCSTKATPNKTDPGIDHGIKWLLRTITKDYPSLNNRVLVDVAADNEKESKIMEERKAHRVQSDLIDAIESSSFHDDGDPFKPISQLIKLPEPNGDVFNNSKTVALSTRGKAKEASEEDLANTVSRSTHSEMFFRSDDWGSTAGLLETTTAPLSFLKRPKSSGPTLDYSVRKKKKRKKRRLRIKSNKTAPLIFQNEPESKPTSIPTIFDSSYQAEVTVFTKKLSVSEDVSQKKSSNEVLLDVTEL